jgi:hypothetical protein
MLLCWNKVNCYQPIYLHITELRNKICFWLTSDLILCRLPLSPVLFPFVMASQQIVSPIPTFFITACMAHIAWIAYEDNALFITPFPAWLSTGAAYACQFLKTTSSTCIRVWDTAWHIFFEGSAKALLKKYIGRSKKKKYTHKLQAFSEGKKMKRQ